MKIAMFTDAYFPRINGVSVSVRSYATELTKLGHKVCVVCLEYSEQQQKNALFDEKSNDESSPFEIIRIPSSGLFFSKEDRMIRFDKLHRINKAMKNFNPDVVHINSEWTIGYFGAVYAHHRKIPFVFTFHTMWEDYLANYVSFLPDAALRKIGRNVVKFYLKRADVIIAPTRRISQVVEDYGIKKFTDIIPTGIPDDSESFRFRRALEIRNRLFKKFPHLRGKKILLFVGRVVKEKNLAFLFDVLVEVQKRFPRTALLFIGNGPYLEELSSIAEKKGLSKSVAFPGYMKSDDLIYFYRLAQVFVFPSKTETQGLVTVEAMLEGLPVVAIGEMGTLDVMQGDNGGYMVPDDVSVFASSVIKLLENQNLRKQKSKEAVKWGQQWRISSLTPKLVECYEKAVRIRNERTNKTKRD
ncbi:glycosyltransferase [Treponema zioleckii]|uniref:glycosyltransferase n=1 Tax=Treponema zioleckii TaxID=331680 RepID=UPI00168B5BFF|nr:glycosyltransferase [Treponema zioleckii]